MYSLRRKGNVMELKEKPAAKRDIRSCDLSARHHLGKGGGGGEKANKQAGFIIEGSWLKCI